LQVLQLPVAYRMAQRSQLILIKKGDKCEKKQA